MPRIYVSSAVEAPIETVWAYVRDFNSLPKWFPGVIDSYIETGKPSDQVGCVRNFGLEDGARMREQLLAFSDPEHSFTYKMIDGPLPVQNYVASVRLLPVTEGNHTFAEYEVTFDCAPAQEDQLMASLNNIYRAAFEHLVNHVPAVTVSTK